MLLTIYNRIDIYDKTPIDLYLWKIHNVDEFKVKLTFFFSILQAKDNQNII